MEHDRDVTGATHQDFDGVFDLGDLTAQVNHEAACCINEELFHETSDLLDSDPLLSSQRADGDSDCSWTQEEDHGDIYVNLSRQLHAFAASLTQITLTLPLLSRQQRHFVHATAQILGLGHASLVARGKRKQMVVYKSDFRHPAPAPPPPTRCDTLVNLRPFQPLDLISTTTSNAVDDPCPKKRKRLQRIDAGFPCMYASCTRVFDRASERTKHEQCHSIAFTERYTCPVCQKGFRYPKDLRRHRKIHEDGTSSNGSGASSNSNGVALASRTRPSAVNGTAAAGMSSLSTTPVTGSAFTIESRVPSDTSLNFSSRPVSTNTSPDIAGKIGKDIEPLVLDPAGRFTLKIMGGSYDEPLENFLDLDFTQRYDDEEDGTAGPFLEMARARR